METTDDWTHEDATPVRVEQWYDRGTRSWVTYLVDATGTQVGESYYDGTRADAAVSKSMLEKELES